LKGQVRVLGTIVGPAAGLLAIINTELAERSTVRAQSIGHERLGPAMPLQGFPEEFQCGLLVPPFRDEALEHFAFVVDGAPEIVPFPLDLLEDLVEMPPPMARSHAVDAALADLGGKYRPEPVPPEPDRLVANVDAALVEKVLDITEREWKLDVHHHRKADDFW
jgi:hypothetical protein